jgi:DNA-binding NtrC family response regulator
MLTVLVVDDDQASRHTTRALLESAGYFVREAVSLADALGVLRGAQIDLILSDVRMESDDDGLKLAQIVRLEKPVLPIVLYSGAPRVDHAVTATRLGVLDYLSLPLDPDLVVDVVARAIDRNARQMDSQTTHNIVAIHPKTCAVVEWAKRLGPTDIGILLLGETGTGKELMARLVHDCSPRRHGPFVAVNCAAVPNDLFEAEFFGHSKGAFTGAVTDRIGLIQEAHRGTLFLDEIAEMPLPMQAGLLRVLENGELRRIGETRSHKVDIRVIAATNRDLPEEIAKKRFRLDLYFRLKVGTCEIPPLRERIDDLDGLIALWLPEISKRFGRSVCQLEPSAVSVLRRHSWPGNVRELRHVLEVSVALASSKFVSECDIQSVLDASAGTIPSRKGGENGGSTDERQNLMRVLAENHWKLGRTAMQLGISRSTLWRKLKLYGIRTD